MSEILDTILFNTCAGTDITNSAGNITINGQRSTRKGNILQMRQVKYRAEVVQVVTVGGTSYTPTGSTLYTIEIGDTNRTVGGVQEQLVRYSYLTPSDITQLGATAALQREAIHGQLVSKINLNTTNYVTAASLGTGTGITITDDAGYYPVNSQTMTNRKGASTVLPCTNGDGSGFASTNYTITTAAVYPFGVGARLVTAAPVIDNMYGNLIQGDIIEPPLTAAGATAVSGQNYDGFVINSFKFVPAPNGQRGEEWLMPRTQTIYADNGTGTSTSNLTGFLAFERAFHKNAWSAIFSRDNNALGEFFDNLICFQDPLGAAPTGTANTLGWQMSPYTGMYRVNIGTQTIVTPVLNDTGLLLDQDDTANEGSHTCASIRTTGAQQFVVGTDEFSLSCRVVAGDWTDVQFLAGFRIKAAYAADYNDYTDLAAIGGGAADGDSCYTFGILNNAATVATDTAVNFTDAVSVHLMIKVALNGTVTAYLNGTSYPIYSAGTTTLMLDAGDAIIPFYQVVNIGSGDPATVISEFVSVAQKDWIVTAV